MFVASFTDAWIETQASKRRIMQARVASFTDAWIETYKEIIEGRFDVSHLLQMRGLKLQVPCYRRKVSWVASFTDAWIETCESAGVFSQCRRIFYRCVD